MAEIARHLRTAFVRVWRDEQGAEGLEKLLILALLILPLLAILIIFGKDIRDWVGSKWDDIKTEADDLDNFNRP